MTPKTTRTPGRARTTRTSKVAATPETPVKVSATDDITLARSAEGVEMPFGELRERMVAEAAYYRAEARGFAPGHELEDWLSAEADVDQVLNVHTRAQNKN